MSTDQPTKICQKIVEWAILADALNLRIFQNHVNCRYAIVVLLVYEVMERILIFSNFG